MCTVVCNDKSESTCTCETVEVSASMCLHMCVCVYMGIGFIHYPAVFCCADAGRLRIWLRLNSAVLAKRIVKGRDWCACLCVRLCACMCCSYYTVFHPFKDIDILILRHFEEKISCH